MQRVATFLVVAVFVSVGLAGCIGQGPVDPGADDTTDDDTSSDVATRATVHGPNVSADADEGEVLAGIDPSIPVPIGVARTTGVQAFEPTIGALQDGTLFMTNREHDAPVSPLLYRSTDDGATWTEVTPKVGPTDVSYPPDTNDVYVHVDRDTGRVFQVDLIALTCSTLSISDDAGETWMQSPDGCGLPPGVHDHQTLFTGPPSSVETVGYDNVVYYCVNRLVDTACATSLNGGLSFGPLVPRVFGGCGGLHAHGVTDSEGRVFLGKADACGSPTVAISADDGTTWTTSVVTEEVDPMNHELALATDDADNVYAFWTGSDRRPYLAYSTDHGASWSDPIDVAPPGVASTSFPTVAAGADGRVALGYYGTAADEAYGEMDGNVTWTAYLTTVLDATDQPVLATTPLHDPADPVGRADCTQESRCYGQGSGGPGDFIDITVGPDGRPWAAMVDSCTETCVEDPSVGNDVAIGFVGTLAEGPSLVGDLRPLDPLDGVGNATAG